MGAFSLCCNRLNPDAFHVPTLLMPLKPELPQTLSYLIWSEGAASLGTS